MQLSFEAELAGGFILRANYDGALIVVIEVQDPAGVITTVSLTPGEARAFGGSLHALASVVDETLAPVLKAQS